MTTSAIKSDATTENQMPFKPQSKGKSNTAAIWNTRVRKKEINAETGPLFNAVKKEEPYIDIPAKRKAKDYT